jgi:phytoene dehydrogenase-like protein
VGHDALIIGAGMSGLAAALRLALHGKSVVVLERHAVWGGLNSFYSLGGRPFDVGLHALTNTVTPGTPGARGAPLTRLLRALRIRHEELALGPQEFSEVVFPSARLSFTNDVAHLEAEVARQFPSQRDGFARLVQWARAYEVQEDAVPPPSARALLAEHLSDPLLREMLLLPVLYYGSAREDDVDGQSLAVLFRAVFLEGFSRPEGGIRTLINLLIRRLKQAGAELRTRAGVRRILLQGQRAVGVELDSGETLHAPVILSSAGWVETQRLAGREAPAADHGRLSFLENIQVLDRPPAELGHRAATSFFSLEDRCIYHRPEDLVDVRTGVVSSPNNYRASRPLAEGQIRISVLANHERWKALEGGAYQAAKARAARASLDAVATHSQDWSRHAVFQDVFTPSTIERFTGHVGGAVYGSPRKHLDGASGIEGLVLIGTDQGYLGVVGAMTSGVLMANRHVISPSLVAGGLAARREALST